jgi:hypothetical protein
MFVFSKRRAGKAGSIVVSKDDGVVKSLRRRHSRVGGNPERIEITRSKSPLIFRLRGNDETLAKCSFYDAIKDNKLTIRNIRDIPRR